MGQRFAIDELNHQIAAVVVFLAVVNGHDVGVVELRGGHRLLEEALARGITNVRQQHLEGHFAPQQGVQPFVNGRCRALAQMFQYLVASVKFLTDNAHDRGASWK